MKIKIFTLFAIMYMLNTSIYAQLFGDSFNMSTDTVYSCDGNFYDSGGSQTANLGMINDCIQQVTYSNNEHYVKTICSESGGTLKVLFSSIEIVGDDDYLKVFEGTDTTITPLGIFTNQDTASMIYLSSDTCLTFIFHSGDNGSGFSGCDEGGNWQAEVSCVDVFSIDNPALTVTCSGLFTDAGGSSGNYAANENYVKTFCAESANCLQMEALQMELGQGDVLRFYSGNDASGTLLAEVTQDNSFPFMGVTSDENECLTVEFISDGTDEGEGWLISVFCPPTCGTPPSCGDNPAADDQCISATHICNFSSYCGNTSDEYSPLDHTGVDWDEVEGLEFCGSVENNSWLTFVAFEETAIFQVYTGACMNNQGVQMQIYETTDCQNFTQVSNCSSYGMPEDFIVQADNLTIGESYYIMVDGFAGDVCDYMIYSQSGVLPVLSIVGEQEICLGNETVLQIEGVNDNDSISVSWTSEPYDASLAGQENEDVIFVTPEVNTTYTCSIEISLYDAECPVYNVVEEVDVIVFDNENPPCNTFYVEYQGEDTVVTNGEEVEIEIEYGNNHGVLTTDFDELDLLNIDLNNMSVINPCQTGSDGSTCAWTANGSFVPRYAKTMPVFVNNNNKLSFNFMMETQKDSEDCDGPDESGEGISLQYSLDYGITWNDITYYHPNGTEVASNPDPNNNDQASDTITTATETAFTQWARYEYEMPAEAIDHYTMLRWYQQNASSSIHDHWGIDSVSIIDESLNTVSMQMSSNPVDPNLNTDVMTAANTSITLNPEVNTWYYVTVFTDAGDSYTDSLLVAVDDPTNSSTLSDEDIKIYPNPAVEEVNVTNLPQGAFIQITDGIGKTLYSETINAKTVNVNVSNYEAGIYFVKIQKDGKEQILRFKKK